MTIKIFAGVTPLNLTTVNVNITYLDSVLERQNSFTIQCPIDLTKSGMFNKDVWSQAIVNAVNTDISEIRAILDDIFW